MAKTKAAEKASEADRGLKPAEPQGFLMGDAPKYDRALTEGGKRFVIQSDFAPAGDQPKAIADIVSGIRDAERDQVLLGVTGSGKTFTIAHTIQEV